MNHAAEHILQGESALERAIKAAIPPDTARFFMPGHKGLLSYIDVTETYGVDDLRAPTGIIKQAQMRAASAFGAAETFFLTGGSSLGNFAMVYAAHKMSENGRIIVNNGCHASVLNICKLLKIAPIFAKNTYIDEFNISGEVLPSEIERLLRENPDVCAVLVTSPTYFGVCSDISGISAICREHGVPLIVDQAHGAHLRFHPDLPADAMSAGADLCVQSAHKTLPALTQTAYLHRRESSIIEAETVQDALNLFQTTSPSYIFMAALDKAREIMETCGKERLDWLIKRCGEFRGKVRCLEGGNVDPTRLVFRANGEHLRKNGVFVEMQDGGNVVCIPTICSTYRDFLALEGCL
ncbi:MAG: aminotransferase class V-fold PLP-dependent enzyme [Clostridiales bacterium]|nr:aminotransferase class V-fold PLP-dependent enzyme [Clostridiales bacterium]